MAVSLEKKPGPHAEGMNGAVAAELRAEKAAQGLNNQDLAERSGIPKVSVQRYLVPTRAIDIDTLYALAAALGRTAVDVMTAAEQRLARQAHMRENVDAVESYVRHQREARAAADTRDVGKAVAMFDERTRSTRPARTAEEMQQMDDQAARDEDSAG